MSGNPFLWLKKLGKKIGNGRRIKLPKISSKTFTVSINIFCGWSKFKILKSYFCKDFFDTEKSLESKEK
ncbi:hypothetical protein AXA65_15865 [Chryseobacterium sp. FP211-J200]|nr:hypothetical protein AXA65_15865 [Chryseobacterium sp. FP211-J200]